MYELLGFLWPPLLNWLLSFCNRFSSISSMQAAWLLLLLFLDQQCTGCLVSPVVFSQSAACRLLDFSYCLSSISSVRAAWFLMSPLLNQQRASCSVFCDHFSSISSSVQAAWFLAIASPQLVACGLLCFLQPRALIRSMLTACFLIIILSRSATGFLVIAPFLDQ